MRNFRVGLCSAGQKYACFQFFSEQADFKLLQSAVINADLSLIAHPSSVVLSGNADKIELSYTQGESADPIQLGSAEYVEDRSTPDWRTIIFKPFIRANSVTITAKKAIDNQQDSYNLHLSIYGCFDSAGK